MNILIIEDDRNIIDVVSAIFQAGWPEVKIVATSAGEQGIHIVHTGTPEMVILDLGLPDISGFEVIRRIRQFSSIPILILSVRGEESDIVRGLGLGANEYLVKPFRPLELLARVRVLLRKDRRVKEDLSTFYGPLRFGPSLRDVIYGEHKVSVTNTEGRVLRRLMASQGDIVTLSELADDLWQRTDKNTAENIKTYIYRLRQKIEDDPHHPRLILAKPGVGYFLSSTDTPTKS